MTSQYKLKLLSNAIDELDDDAVVADYDKLMGILHDFPGCGEVKTHVIRDALRDAVDQRGLEGAWMRLKLAQQQALLQILRDRGGVVKE